MPDYLAPWIPRHESITGGPGTPVPPMSIFAVGFAAAFGWHQHQPWLLQRDGLDGWVAASGVLLLVFGAGLFTWGLETFARARTGILLQRAATHLVACGPYRWSRNPMYIGCVASYVGAAILLNTVWPLFLLPVAVGTLTSVVIAREERYMRQRFGSEYASYCQRVPRWL